MNVCNKCSVELTDDNQYRSAKSIGSRECKKCANKKRVEYLKIQHANSIQRVFTDLPTADIVKLNERKLGARRKLEPDDVTLAIVKSCARIGCSDTEMAAALSVTIPTWVTFRKTFEIVEQTIEQARGSGKTSLRRKTWELAEKGNWNALQHLNKHVLGEHDKTTQDVNVNVRRSALDMDDTMDIESSVVDSKLIASTHRTITDDPED